LGTPEVNPPNITQIFAKKIKFYQFMKGKTIEEIYKKKTQLEHILDRPDTYVGKFEEQTVFWSVSS
jgi:hypothetical protein